MREISDKIRTLSPEKCALLEKMIGRRDETGATTDRGRIPVLPRDKAHYVLSSAQQRLWFLEQYENTPGVFNLHSAVRITGGLDLEILRRSVEALVLRHESLRTCFTKIDSMPCQMFVDEPHFGFEVFDISKLAAGASVEAAIMVHVRDHARQAFDLANGPLLAVAVVVESDRSHVLMLAMHHIVSDAWSISLMINELMANYDAFQNVRSPGLAPPDIQYIDYAAWQQEHLKSPAIAGELSYWKQQLRGAPEFLDLPTDYLRPDVQSYRGAEICFRVSKDLAVVANKRARSEGATPFMIGLLAYGIVLAKTCNQRDVLIGTDIANRNRRQTESLIGFFVNQLVMRLRFDNNPTLLELLHDSRKICLDAYANQNLPFNYLVEELNVVRDPARTPLYQAKYMMQNIRDADTAGVGVEMIEYPEETSQFELLLSLKEVDNGMLGSLRYRTDLFARSSAQCFVDQYVKVLGLLAQAPQTRFADVALITDDQRDWVAADNDTAVPVFAHDLVEQIAEHARRNGQAVALCQNDETLDYATLMKRIEALAVHYLEQGLTSADRIAICMVRGIDMIVALLAAVRAGICYVPLDPEHGEQRLDHILSDADVRLVVTDEPVTWIRERSGIEQMVLSARFFERLESVSVTDWATPHAEQLVYILYTSGSTGKPKGVAVRHAGLNNFLQTMQGDVGLTSSDVFLAVTTIAFDIAALELYLPLFCGATVVVANKEQAADSRLLISLLEDRGITMMQATPATWRGICSVAKGAAFGIRALCGGEALDARLAVQLHGMFDRLVNMYGPTETTIWSSCLTLTPDQLQDVNDAPIGNPVSNTQFHVLDEFGNPQSFGARGELFIGGAGLARGYWNRPALTAAAFVPNPYSASAGARMYRTGDDVKRLADGRLVYLGRRDFQVKVRGYRIELGEIEAVLQNHVSIVQAALTTSKSQTGELSLVAFVVPAEGHAGDDETARRRLLLAHARQYLPSYMLPTQVIWIDDMPLTASGKLDRKVLGAMALDYVQASTPQKGIPLATQAEKTIGAIWSKVLGVDEVYLEQDFFEFGGHSLLAIRLLDEIESVTTHCISLQAFFRHPTIKGIVELTQDAPAKASDYPQIVSDPQHLYDPFGLTDIQQAYLVGRNCAVELGSIATQNYLEINVRGLDVERFTRAWNLLVLRHGMLRTIFDSNGTQRTLAHVPAYVPTYYDLKDTPEDEAHARLMVVREEMRRCVLPETTGPLFDLRIARLDRKRYRIHLCLDMLICDVASAYILFDELEQLYRDGDAALPELLLTFRDYVVAEAELKESPRYAAARSYWLARLDDFPTAPELPLACDPSQLTGQTFERREFHIEKDIWQRLTRRARDHRVSPTVLLLTAFGEILACWGKTPRFAINLTLFNRLPLHPQVHDIVGDFTSSLLLVQEHSSNDTFAGSARKVQDRLWLDLDNKTFSGVDVIRELTRTSGGAMKALMPVVFTSILGFSDDLPEGEQHPTEHNLVGEGGLESAEEGYSVSQTSQVWLDHQVAEHDGGATLVWDAVEELFPAAMLDDMFSAYTERLLSLASDDLAWQSTGVRVPYRQLDVRRNVNACTAPLDEALLHSPFEQSVKTAPDNIAIRAPEITLTYRELDERSNALAHQLVDAGATRNELIAICMHKGFEQIVAALAILKAGAAYTPVDSNWPEQRQMQLLDEGQCKIVVTQGSPAEFIEHCGQRIFHVDTSPPSGDVSPLTGPTASWRDIAYVIFTSGSTGTPKGVVIDHRGAVNTVVDINRRFGVTENDAVLAMSSLGFDLSVYDVFGLLAVGGTIVVPGVEHVQSPRHWWSYVCDHHVTIWNTVPALMQLLVQHCETLPQPQLGPLRLVMMSGDWIPVSLPDRIRDLSADCDVISLGGATEASIWSIFHPVEGPSAHLRSIPYGKPLTNQSLWVLDSDMQPRPDWVAGDLYIGGIGVARGYWNNPVRTAASFVETQDHGILYRTGDLGRYTTDGVIEFLGRDDSQVKIQGYRVELGEVEAALQSHPAVAEAVVSAMGSSQESKTLVAYLVPQAVRSLIGEDIRDNGSAGQIIVAPQERSLFKLQQHGSRVLPADMPRIAMERPERLTGYNEGATARKSPPLKHKSIGYLLGGLRQVTFDDSPLPKYFYPSASSLYPVQVYIYADFAAGLGYAGFYYYSNRENALVKLADRNPLELVETDSSIHLYWVASMDAILPMYVQDQCNAFVHLEAGYMQEIVRNQAGNTGFDIETSWYTDQNIGGCELLPAHSRWLGTSILSTGPPECGRPSPVRGDEGDEGARYPALAVAPCAPLPDYDVLQRQSYRRFSSANFEFEKLAQLLDGLPCSGLRTFVFVKPQCCGALTPTSWYEYDAASRRLEVLPADSAEASLTAVYGGGNGPIFEDASFALFWVDDNDTPSAENWALAGALGQRLMAQSWVCAIGLCPIGYIEEQPLRDALKLTSGARVLHSFVGGGIEREQTVRWQQDSGAQPSAPSVQDFIDYLGQRLPAYMVPRIYVPIDSVPLSSNGKVDRKALPQPEARANVSHLYEAPMTHDEQVMADVWSGQLGVERVGISDNFFTLGGNSLIAMQMISELRVKHGIDVTLRDLFESPTITGALHVARNVSAAERAAADADIDSRRSDWLGPADADAGAGDTHFPVSLAQQHLFFTSALQDDQSAYNIPAALQIDGPLDVEILKGALQTIVDRHQALRTAFDYVDGELRQKVSAVRKLSFKSRSLEHLANACEREARIDEFLNQDARDHFDLHAGPLLRCQLIRSRPDSHVLMINVHHIVSDYLSMDILVREMGELYNARRNGVEEHLPVLKLQFSDLVLSQRAFLQSDRAARQLKYWLQDLNGIPPLEFPDERRHRSSAEADGWQSYEFGTDLLGALHEACTRTGVTMFMMGLAAVHQLVRSVTATDDIAIGTPMSMRHNPDMENLIGLMLNTLVVRVAPAENGTGEDLLGAVKASCLRAFDNKDIPYEEVQRQFHKRGQYLHKPIYRVRYVYRKIERRGEPADSDLSIKDRDIARTSAKFDLLVTLNESEDSIFGELEYRSTVWSPTTIATMNDSFRQILTWVAMSPHRQLKTLQNELLAETREVDVRRQQRLHESRGGALAKLARRKSY